MRGTTYAQRVAQYLLEVRQQQLQTTKEHPIDVDCESDSTHEPYLEGDGTNSRGIGGIFGLFGEEVSQECKNEEFSGSWSSFGVEKMDVEEEILAPSNG